MKIFCRQLPLAFVATGDSIRGSLVAMQHVRDDEASWQQFEEREGVEYETHTPSGCDGFTEAASRTDGCQ